VYFIHTLNIAVWCMEVNGQAMYLYSAIP